MILLPTVQLDNDQARLVTVQFFARCMCIQKQYLSQKQLFHYRFILQELASLRELEDIAKNFDKAWPQEIKFEDIE